MSYIKIYIHAVWSTKNRSPFLHTLELRKKVWNHIKENSITKDIFIDHINGWEDHCHCLLSLRKGQTIQECMQLIKGESSFWINKNNLTAERFAWQTNYFAVSVSPSMLDKTRNYIRNQEEHHKKTAFKKEYDELMKIYKDSPG